MRRWVIGLASACAAASVVPSAFGAAFTVNAADDTINGVCDAIHCSLREAIIAANTSADSDVIGFSIFAGPQTIAITSLMPQLSGPDTIDGATQPGYSGSPIIEVDGSAAGDFAPGFIVPSGGLIRALVVNRFGGSGVRLDGNARVEASYIGTDITGTVDRGNLRAGVETAGTNNVIGGTAAGAGNLISGNDSSGVILNTSFNQVLGNVIGLNAAGTSAIGNCLGGVRIFNSSNTIGGTAAGAGNVISGNQGCAVGGWAGVTAHVGANSNTIQGNRIGTNAAGTAVIPTGDIGVRIMGAENNIIGGTAAGAANVITGPTTAVDIGDFSGNPATGNFVLGNYIGTNAAGADLGSGGPGVTLNASGNSVGDTGAGGNAIAHGDSHGVVALTGTQNRIVGNQISDHALLGIDLGADGVTANDAGDADTGPNDRQNFPVLTSALLTASDLAISGTLSSAASTTYRLEFFYSPSCDGSGHGEGAEKRGFVTVTTNASGSASFTADSAGGSVAVGGQVSATATDPDGNTSEFAACTAVTSSASTFVVNSAADPGDGTCDATCTLRDALDDANAAPTDDRIEFAIGTGPQLISLADRLLVTDTVEIAGDTQPGYAGAPLIELDGSDVVANPDDGGIELFAGAPGSTIADLVLNGFDTNAIGVYGLGNTIEGNYIGTNAAGSAAIANRDAGIYLQDATGTTIHGNVIAGNDRDGIRIVGADGTSNSIVSNRIGMDAEGDVVGNGSAGVSISASRNTIGPGNVIVGNGSAGIDVVSGIRNQITQNDIRGNAGLGIDLGSNGVTPNDIAPPPDADAGANNLQNFPTLGTVSTDATATEITGTLTSTPDSFFEVELFASPNCDPTGTGEGQTPLGSITMTTDPTGEASWSRTVGAVPVGHVITATATDSVGNTSEFSSCSAVQSDATAFTVNSSADTNDGTCNASNCTLREAMNAANADDGVETIGFAIGTGAVTITPGSALPVVTEPVVLDATTQPGYSGAPLVRLDGAGAGPSTPGIEIVAGGSTVRGFAITNFTWDGVKMEDGDGNTVEDNYLGVRVDGDSVAGAGNGTYGVLADFGSAGNVIRGNLIGGNGFGAGAPYSGIGIWHAADDNVVEDNEVGVGPGGESLPNAIGVIVAEASGTGLSGNTIANSTGNGVWVFGPATARNAITSNSIHSNGGLGIDLEGAGVTANDSFDADTGANDLQNFPVITAVDGGVIQGTIHSKALFEYRIEYFASDACDPSGNGEGGRFLGATTNVGTGQTGNGEFSASFPSIGLDEFVTATATDPDGNTSEFSSCFAVGGGAGVTADVTIAPAGSASVTAPAQVELEDVPAETFIAAARAALEAAPLGAIPLGAIPLGAIPLGAIPLGAIGFLEPQIRLLLGGVALSTVPLTPPQSWSALLQGTSLAGLPLQSLSLQQALDALAGQPTGIGSVPLGAIGLRGSVLGSLTPEAVGLGVAPLGAIDIGDEGVDEPGDANLDDWCEWLSGPPVNCTNPASLQTESVLSTSLRGVPLGAIPLGAIPLGAIPLGAIPLGAIPLGAIDIEFSPLGAIPLGAIPLGAIPLGAIPLGAIPLGAIDLQGSPLGAIPLGAIPANQLSSIFTCSQSCPTSGLLRDHRAQLKPGLTLEQLMRAVGPAALGNVTFADVILWVAEATLDDYTVSQLVETLLLVPDNELTFADLLAAFLAESSLGWEGLNLETAGVNRIAAASGTAHYAVEVTLTPDPPAGPGSPDSTVVKVTLPDGFAYVPGSSQLDDLSAPAPPGPVGDPAGANEVLTWTLPLTVGPTFRLTFDAHPRSTLGPALATVEADPAAGPLAVGAAPATVVVTDTFEPNNDPGGSLAPLATSSFYLSYVTGADDVDFYTYPVPAVAGTRVTFKLSHLADPLDADLVVYGPAGQVLRNPQPGTEPLDGQPLDDDGPSLTSEADALAQQALSDLALANLPILGIATLRGTEDDAVTVVSDGQPGTYVIQVSGFNGSSSPEPYMLRPEQRAPVALPSCQARSFANTGTNSTSLTRGTVPAGVDTVFVVNKAQWERVHGAGAVASALTALDGQMAALAADGHPSAILQVDADADVQGAVANWNVCPTELTRANAVMREIGLAIDAFRAAHVDAGSNSTVQNIVLLGGDEVIPSARLEDRTTVANEDGYAETFNAGSELATTLRQAYFLSDDPYGDVDPIPFFDRQLHIPDVPVGRLPGLPATAVRTVARFTAFDGRLAPATAATSGYEFLTDGAQQVDAALRSIAGVGGSNPPGLIGDDWNEAALLSGFFPGGVPRDLSSINGHADHRGLEPAAGTSIFDITDLPAPTGGATEPFDRKLVFSMGCHAGLSVPDVFVVSPLGTADWAQAYTQRGATYAASSGFAYGDGKLVAYSEDLHRRFAEHLGGFANPGDLSIGEAMVLAKQDYFGELGLVGVYDEKASSEFTLYGLPMWQIGGTAGATAPASAPAATASLTAAAADPGTVTIQSLPSEQELVVEPTTGLTAERLATDWTPPPATPATGGSYMVGRDGVQVTHFRPVEPKTVLPVTVPSAHGALITELTSTSITPFDPYFARPIVDSTAHEPLLDWDRLVHPAKLQTVTTSKLGTSKLHRLVLATGQFTGPPGGSETGTQRLFPHIEALVFSAASNDYAKPILGRMVATGIGSNVAFSVETHDLAPNGADDVVRVRVGYLDQPDGGTTRAWRFIDLVRTPSTDRWSGAGPLVSATAQFLYFVQSVDRAGNVAVSTNKGIYYEEAAAAPPTDDGLSIDAPAPPASGWYGGNVLVTVRLGGQPAGAADNLEVDVDGGGFHAYTGPVTVTGDGSHTVTAKAPDGREVSLTVLIDTAAPQIVITSPAAGAQIVQGQPLTADYSCLDAGIGVDPSACVGTVANGAAISTAVVGPKTFTVTGTDRLGRSAARTISYTVVRRSILFTSSRTGSGDIYAVGEGGGAVARLTDHSALDAEPAVSPDGSRIAFTSTRNGNVELYSMNPDGTDVQRLTNHSAVDSSPAWSPDGTKIAFSSNRSKDQFDIWVMNADGTGLQQLTTHKDADLTPAWAPNGSKIAFVSARTGGDGDVYVMNANGSSQTRLTTSNAADFEPDWSPDGTKIAFATNRHGDSNFELYVMNANGSSQTRLTTNSANDISPNWSADGLRLVFSSTRDGNLELYVANANAGNPTRVTVHPGIDATPDW